MKRLFTLSMIVLACGRLQAQTPLLTDNLMMPKKDLGVGVFYGNDQWTNYWEGSLLRKNGNIGTLTTQMVSAMAAYGISERVTVIATAPYVWTKASGGTLKGMSGVQDLTVAGKYNFFKQSFQNTSVSFIALGAVSLPLTDYSADFMPLSIGMGCLNTSGRLTGNFTYKQYFITGSAAYTWRGNITLDRPSYYTNGHLYNTNEVKMPDVIDFIVRLGYKAETWHFDLFYTQQNTQGGGDIERQNMPFVSNKMNASKLGFSGLVFIPQLKNVGVRIWSDVTISGRNVGQSTSFMGGLVYRFGPASTQN